MKVIHTLQRNLKIKKKEKGLVFTKIKWPRAYKNESDRRLT